jgi:penicillin-binding protein 1C
MHSGIKKVQVVDRRGISLNMTYQNRWNVNDNLPLYEMPELLKSAFVISEDKRYYRHGGVDWRARLHALVQNITSFSVVRGASTITEQVIRMLHPRPRTVWSRWLEGFEAASLERRFSKDDIFEFYLNQVPYASKRRGMVQAARHYFNRDLDTLSPREMLALTVLVRAPSHMDLFKDTDRIRKPLRNLAGRMVEARLITPDECQEIIKGKIALMPSSPPVPASHFVRYVEESSEEDTERPRMIVSTLDSSLQHAVQEILDTRINDLNKRNVSHGAVLVVDNKTAEVLAWVNRGGGGFNPDKPSSYIDAVTTPRQPGSTLKPFLYAMALENGWTAATIIEDTPLVSPVSTGLHEYRNYSRQHYGAIRLREALGNSLNIPAVRTVGFVGIEEFLRRLHEAGLKSLDRHPVHYGEGIALGNGEVSLYELVRAYAIFARKGLLKSLVIDTEDLTPDVEKRVFSEEVVSVISNILSDPDARILEFGNGGLLKFPVQTAVKTGTSTDYRDAWSVGYNDNYTIGVWMGNMDRTATLNVTGSTGPALVLRAVFNELNRNQETRPLFLSSRLSSTHVCSVTGFLASAECPSVEEWFLPDTLPKSHCTVHMSANDQQEAVAEHHGERSGESIRLIQPTQGLYLAMDPRIPDELEQFAFVLPGNISAERVDWIVDDVVSGNTSGTNRFLWRLSKGTHTVFAKVWFERDRDFQETEPIQFHVK